MTNNHTEEQTTAASAAMNRVLEAEHEAELAVAECEREAQAVLQAGYVRAQRITTRTDERISLLRMRSSDRVTRRIEVMERAERAIQQSASPEQPQAARLDAIVEELAAEFCGGTFRASDGEADS